MKNSHLFDEHANYFTGTFNCIFGNREVLNDTVWPPFEKKF